MLVTLHYLTSMISAHGAPEGEDRELNRGNLLPYTDAKDMGAADFYFGINATFRFIRQRFGIGGLRGYWEEMGREYFRPVTERWRVGGLPAVAAYWRAFFRAEPGADVKVAQEDGKVVVHVFKCPAIGHLRRNGQAILPEFCQHCHFVSNAMGQGAGLAARISGGNGSCCQEFVPSGSASLQDLEHIALCV